MTAPVDLRYFAGRIEKLSKRLDQVPRMSWATVVTTAPLTIHVDGDPAPLIGEVKNAGPKILLPGTRVQVMRQDLRYTVISASVDVPSRGTSAQRVALGLSGVLVDGHRFYDTDEKREYSWVNGAWQGDTDWVDLLSYVLPTWRNICQARRKAGMIEILFNGGSGSIPVGNTALANFPTDWAPKIAPNRRAGAYFGSGYTGVFYMTPDGEFGVSQQTGGARNNCQGHMLFAAD